MKALRSKVTWCWIAGLVMLFICTSCGQPEPTPEMPTPTEPPKVKISRDVAYVQPSPAYEKGFNLDIYQPVQSGQWPVLLFFHGFSGTKEGFQKESSALAEQGLVVVTPTWPTILVDIATQRNGQGFRDMADVFGCAIRFARQNAGAHGGDPSHLTLMGFSYGAAFGSWVALLGDDMVGMWDEFSGSRDGPSSQIQCAAREGSVKVDALVTIGGMYDIAGKVQKNDPELWALVDPMSQIDNGQRLPVRVLHGLQDDVVHHESSINLNELLQKAQYDSSLTLFEGGHEVPVDQVVEIVLTLSGQ